EVARQVALSSFPREGLGIGLKVAGMSQFQANQEVHDIFSRVSDENLAKLNQVLQKAAKMRPHITDYETHAEWMLKLSVVVEIWLRDNKLLTPKAESALHPVLGDVHMDQVPQDDQVNRTETGGWMRDETA